MTWPLNIIMAQLNPTVGDLEGNFEKIKTVWEDHTDSDLIIFPEMIVTGYPADDLLLKPDFIHKAQDVIQDLVTLSQQHSAMILIGAPSYKNDYLYNSAYIIGDGKIQLTILKNHLPNYGIFDEKRYFTSPEKLHGIFHFKGHKIGVLICEDTWFDDVSAHLAKQGAEILLSMNGSHFKTGKETDRQRITRARVQETGLPLIYVNQVGGQDDLLFDGQSFALDKDGNITHQLPAFEESVISVLHDNMIAPKLSDDEKHYKAITLGLRDYISKNGFNGVLIGLSGGIDSALSAAIAVDALGADKVHCVMMPSPFTSQDSLDDAKECAKMLGVAYDIIPISDGMQSFEKMLGNHTDKSGEKTTFENIQSRIRGTLLMALSNETGKMVLSTGNKSEMAVGYATLYGDMCGGYNAIKDLYKGQVYSLSQWRNKQSPAIPQRILTKAPTAELKHNQTDQDTLPPYDVLDDILECLIEKEMALEDIPHDEETILKVWTMLNRAEYKRNQAPPGPKVSGKSFGRDRRYPITNGFLKNHKKSAT